MSFNLNSQTFNFVKTYKKTLAYEFEMNAVFNFIKRCDHLNNFNVNILNNLNTDRILNNLIKSGYFAIKLSNNKLYINHKYNHYETNTSWSL